MPTNVKSFAPALEPIAVRAAALRKDEDQGSEFCLYYTARCLPVARVAIGAAIALAIAVWTLAAFVLPGASTEKVLHYHLLAILLPMSLLLILTFTLRRRRWIPYVVMLISVIVGISIAIASTQLFGGVADVMLWGVLYMTINVYLLFGLNAQQGVVVGGSIFVAFVSSGVAFSVAADVLVYSSIFLCFVNIAGCYVGYILQQNAREIFTATHEASRRAHLDGLTGLANRETFDGHLRRVWKQACREEKRVAVVLVDIDFFKLYNDCYGHQKGDQCINVIAETLCASTNRPLDLVCRYGSAEFAAILFDPSQEFVAAFSNGTCEKIADLGVEHKASNTSGVVSVSIGAAVSRASETMSTEQLLRRADDALYEAQSLGRNRAVVYKNEWGDRPASIDSILPLKHAAVI